eukprot:1419746-Pleurochrysis_carterae.AAC.2
MAASSAPQGASAADAPTSAEPSKDCQVQSGWRTVPYAHGGGPPRIGKHADRDIRDYGHRRGRPKGYASCPRPARRSRG